MLKIHPEFRILSVSRDLSSSQIAPNRIRCAVEEIKKAIGPAKGELIGIAIEKCPLTVILMLGILESENAFIYIPCESESYVQVMAERFKVNWILRGTESPESEQIVVDSTKLWMERRSDFKKPWDSQIAYAIQTSGTTGKPKTVHVPWQCIRSNIIDFRDRFNITKSDVILQLTSHTFDPSMVEILLAANTGAELVVFTEEIGLPSLSAQPALLSALMDQIRPTFLQITPSCLCQFRRGFLAELLGPRSAIRILLLGGEAFPLNLVNSVRSMDNPTRIFNVYGVTEVSCWASVQEITFGEKRIQAGEPIADTELRVVDGEVVIDGGRFCFVDYGTEKAIPHRTGDLGYYAEGKITVIGRRKPNAILPSTEVEDLILKEFKQIVLTKVIFDGNFAVLFYKSEESLDGQVMDAVIAHLPPNKRPGLVCHVSEWPITKNGKVDDDALLWEARKRIQINSADSLEQLLLEYGISVDRDRDETFHNLGFTSLKATELLFKLEPLVKEDQKGDLLQFLLSGDGKVSELLNRLTFPKRNKDKDDVHISALRIDGTVENPELLWSSDLKKCIDASPVILDGLVFVGSHAGIFKVIDLQTGELKLKMDVDGRIEKTCAFGEKYIAFGTYAGKLYVLDRKSFDLATVFDMGYEVIKCTPIFDSVDRLYCGSHDRRLVKFNLENSTVDYRTPLNGAIVSTPLLLENGSIAVATLSGQLYLLDQISGESKADVNLNSPVFAPIISFHKHGFVVSTVTGTVALFDMNLKEITRIDVKTHQYDAPCVASTSQLICCGQNGSIHVVLFDGVEFCLVRTVIWKDSVLVRAPVIVEEFFLFSSTKGSVVAIHRDSLLAIGNVLKVRKLLQLDGEIFGAPAILKHTEGHRIVIGSRDNFIRCFNVDLRAF